MNEVEENFLDENISKKKILLLIIHENIDLLNEEKQFVMVKNILK
jgi:hypothetical protein